jgi:hypothetical protein
MPSSVQFLAAATVNATSSGVLRGDIGQEVTLFWNITGTVTGTTPTITFTLTEVDPGNESTTVGQTISSSAVNATGQGSITLSLINSPTILVTWTVTGTTPAFNGTYLTAVAKTIGSKKNMAGIFRPLYGPNNQALTITLASLASSATAARASTAVDNTTTLYEDALIFVKLTSAAASTSATGYANIYGYATVDNGTTYSENVSGTDAAITLVAPSNLILLAQVNIVANAVTYRAGPFSFCRMYGLDRLPQKWGIVVANVSGATLNATAGNHAITWQGVNGQFI